MPAPGDQHRVTSTTTNPFEEPENRVATYTAEQIASLQSRLNKFLGPEYISTRDGPGGKKVHYIAAVQCIQLANEIFGFNGWSSSIRDVQVDYVEEIPNTGKFNMAVSVIMRVTLRDGTYHEDIGYGQIENCKSKAVGFEKTKKEATTDALKRALRNFGNVLGNCIYDKDYTVKVTKIKVKPPKFNVDDLHRHADYAIAHKMEPPCASEQSMPPIVESLPPTRSIAAVPGHKIAVEDDFDTADFDDVDFSMADEGHPDEVVVEDPVVSNHFTGGGTNGSSKPTQQSNSHNMTGINQNQPGSNTAGKGFPAPNSMQAQVAMANSRNSLPQSNPNSHAKSVAPSSMAKGIPSNRPAQHNTSIQSSSYNSPAAVGQNLPKFVDISADGNNQTITNTSTSESSDQAVPFNAMPVFLSARAAAAAAISQTPNGTKPNANDLFNPQAESPSIRKTAGIDHTKSMALKKAAVKDFIPSKTDLPTPSIQAQAGNPNTDGYRKIGMQPSAASPIANRSSYKPPSKRPLDNGGGGLGQARQPLNDVTPSTNNVGLQPPVSDPKRQRIDGGIAAKPISQ